jgi:hypothetical protein
MKGQHQSKTIDPRPFQEEDFVECEVNDQKGFFVIVNAALLGRVVDSDMKATLIHQVSYWRR